MRIEGKKNYTAFNFILISDVVVVKENRKRKIRRKEKIKEVMVKEKKVGIGHFKGGSIFYFNFNFIII